MADKFFYKILRRDFTSAVTTHFRLMYGLGRWTVAPANTKIFIFDTLEHSELFLHGAYNAKGRFIICSCEAEGVECPPLLIAAYESNIVRFWELWEKFKPKTRADFERWGMICGLLTPPAFGTLWADKVRLIERVWPEERR